MAWTSSPSLPANEFEFAVQSFDPIGLTPGRVFLSPDRKGMSAIP